MRIQTECMSYKDRWTISSSYDFQAHQPCSQWCCCSQTALLSFEVLSDLSLALSDLSQALPGVPRCSQACRRRFQILWTPAGMPSYGLILSWNWCIQVYTPHLLRHSWRLPVTKIYFADVSDAEIEATTRILTDTDCVENHLQGEIDDITWKNQMWFANEFPTHLVKCAGCWQAIGAQGIRKTIE